MKQGIECLTKALEKTRILTSNVVSYGNLRPRKKIAKQL